MKRFLLLALLMSGHSLMAAEAGGWIPLFNGHNLDGWKASENPATFKVENGTIVAHGPRAHLFYMGPVQDHNFRNFRLKAEIMTAPGSNSGVYLHTAFQESGWPAKGYEIQVNNTHRDPKKTAGVYGIKDNFEAPAKDNEWFTLEIEVVGRRIRTFVNGRPIADYTEEEKPVRKGQFTGRMLSSGTFALQGHDPASRVSYRSIAVKPLP
jgi:hypothetical protein